ncbi:glycosyltransferase family 2 protein [Nostoc sp.]|uniref:glycosyltransferase family 2 protein n=1 Tax=Nostoc sp. TaxID=1180 RepID=UPI002FF77C9E
MTNPLISVVIATYNTGRYLPETLESVIAQTYRNWEIIVVDDGSTDNTHELIKPYLSCICFIQQKHGGLASARNAGLQLAKGDFIALLDADDLWLPEKLAIQVEIAGNNPESGLIASDGVEFDDQKITSLHLLHGSVANKLFDSKESEITGHFHHNFFKQGIISCPAQTLLPRHLVEEIGSFGDFSAQDYDYYLRTALRFPITFHRHSLVRWRYHAESMSGHWSRRKFVWNLQILLVMRNHLHRCNEYERYLLNYEIFRTVFRTSMLAYDYGNKIDQVYAVEVLTELLQTRNWSLIVLIFKSAIQVPEPIHSFIYQVFLGLLRVCRFFFPE